MEEVIINRQALLEKFAGKGGWTYISVPEITPNYRNQSGQVKINGSIDNYTLKNATLMPFGNGTLFLPINAAIRKTIKKSAGDTVNLKIFVRKAVNITKEAFVEVLADEPEALAYYNELASQEQQHYIDWINETKDENVKIERMAFVVNKIYDLYRHKK
ncbi:DUF1905 domain-containing protein [Olivibacter sp. SDN3]|uniref:YdeI/OmpD-associated family protein n=1 Tax=Olivibacter sp. SDN3 TaxID=2764720 RepID=UPI001650DEC2|nr:YdeI/OmpD-associated family protein [Olivibacter sp. SDN3]QNL48406.1 DUF1905 domain-containing protein [Olivibacter sp. SDN3]